MLPRNERWSAIYLPREEGRVTIFLYRSNIDRPRSNELFIKVRRPCPDLYESVLVSTLLTNGGIILTLEDLSVSFLLERHLPALGA